MANNRTVSLVIVAIGSIALGACGSRNSGENDSSSAAATGVSVSTPAGRGTCALLTMAEAKAAFPDVTLAKPYTDLEKVGIQACDFGSKETIRRFQVRLSKSSVEQEMVTFETGVMDPMKQSHLKRDKFGAGGEVIISEMGKTPDALGDMGVAALQKGPNTIVVSTSTVVGGRDTVEKRLIALVTSAAARVR